MLVLCAPPTLKPSVEGTTVGGAGQSGSWEQHLYSAVVRRAQLQNTSARL